MRVITVDFRSVCSDMFCFKLHSANCKTCYKACSFLCIACLFSKLCGRNARSCHIKPNNLDTALTLSITIQVYWTNGQEKVNTGCQRSRYIPSIHSTVWLRQHLYFPATLVVSVGGWVCNTWDVWNVIFNQMQPQPIYCKSWSSLIGPQ